MEVHGLQKAVRAVRDAGKTAVVATPRVLKPEEEQLWRFYLNLGADALLIRSAGLLQTLLELRDEPSADVVVPPLRGDFSLNAANAIAADVFLRSGLERLTPTHDLNAEQQRALAVALGPAGASSSKSSRDQHLPIFHTEHCVFCRFLSDGDSFRDCGHPCETSHVHLRDDRGDDHLVLADMGCRNTAFNARNSGVENLDLFLDAGISHFRVELVDEPADVVQDLSTTYIDVAEGRRSPADACVGSPHFQTPTGARTASPRLARGEDRALSRRASSDRRGVSRGEREDTEIWARAPVEPIDARLGVPRLGARRSARAREPAHVRASIVRAMLRIAVANARACRGVLARDVPARVSSRVRVARASSRAAGSDAAGTTASGTTPRARRPSTRRRVRRLGSSETFARARPGSPRGGGR